MQAPFCLWFFDFSPVQIALFHTDLIPHAMMSYQKKLTLLMCTECCHGLNTLPQNTCVQILVPAPEIVTLGGKRTLKDIIK